MALFAQRRIGDEVLMAQAQDYFLINDYEKALEFYERVAKNDSTNAGAQYGTGVCYYFLRNESIALQYLVRARKLGYKPSLDPDFEPRNVFSHDFESHDIEFCMARCYHSNYEFKTALEYYRRFSQRLHSAGHIGQEAEASMMRYIQTAKNGLIIKENPDVVITNLGAGVNTAYEEVSPLVTGDGNRLIFTSRRPGSTGNRKDINGRYLEDIYVTYREEGVWEAPNKIGMRVNTTSHDAAVGMSTDGRDLYVYKGKNINTGNLYVSRLNAFGWGFPKRVDGVNSDGVENGASVSVDGRTMVFSSNRPSGKGGYDIYMAERMSDGSWGNVQNMGTVINTEEDEDTPFLHPDGKTLYFSSRGHNSIGGYDMFKSEYNETTRRWSKPVNLGIPINSGGDDLGLVWTVDGRDAYFCSHRNGGFGDLDIYHMTDRNKPHTPMCLVEGHVLSAGDSTPVKAFVSVFDGESVTKKYEFVSDPETGVFSFVMTPGETSAIRVVQPMFETYMTTIESIKISDKGECPAAVKLCLTPLETQIIELKSVFFDNNKAKLRPESYGELIDLADFLKKYPQYDVEIAGHTELGGVESNNDKLSLDRAKAVLDYLARHGVKRKRMEGYGHGGRFPKARGDEEEQRQKNRRIEIILHDRTIEGKRWKAYYGRR